MTELDKNAEIAHLDRTLPVVSNELDSPPHVLTRTGAWDYSVHELNYHAFPVKSTE